MIKRFECDICHRKYRYMFYLVKHKKNEHADQRTDTTPGYYYIGVDVGSPEGSEIIYTGTIPGKGRNVSEALEGHAERDNGGKPSLLRDTGVLKTVHKKS